MTGSAVVWYPQLLNEMPCHAGEQTLGVTEAHGGRVVGGWLYVIGQCKRR